MATLIERVRARVQIDGESDCWNWSGAIDDKGYGRIRVGSSIGYVHRVSWQETFGDVPEGLELDHLCRNRACCNPDHLEPVTHAVNVQRGWPFRPRREIRPGRSAVAHEPCTTQDARRKHLSADLNEPYFNGVRGRAACGRIAYSQAALPSARTAPIADLPECQICAKAVAS